MCTALTFRSRDCYFGRNLDLEYRYHETVTVTPRKFPLKFRRLSPLEEHYALIGMAYICEGYPLYYDCINEEGLAMAGLLFPNGPSYWPEGPGQKEAASFELIPWVLGQCANLEQARNLLEGAVITDARFSRDLPPSPLHWLLADRSGTAVVLEMGSNGLQVLDDPIGVLTNAPSFEVQMLNLTAHMALSPYPPVNRLAREVELPPFSRGLGAAGLPGDLSSPSRFVRCAFVRSHSRCGPSEEESVHQFFHILGSVEQQRGCVVLEDDRLELTQYSCCCNLCKGIYYYTTYDNRRISAVGLHRENTDGRDLISYPLTEGPQILWQN